MFCLSSKKNYHSRFVTDSPELALTFDDGPDASSTLKVLDLLDKHEIKASFFLIGEKARKQSKIVQEIFNRGHEIGNHSYTHGRALLFSTKKLKQELDECQKVLEDLVGPLPRFFRPPRGELLPWMVTPIQERGYEILLWSLMPGDFYSWHSADLIERRVKEKVQKGDILLLHDGLDLVEAADKSATLKALESLLPFLKKQYQFLSLKQIFPTYSLSPGGRGQGEGG